jgi:hypothetical protein
MALECLSDVMRRELMLFDVHFAFVRPGAIDVAAVVFKAGTDPREKVMYRVNNELKQRIVFWLPAKLIDRVLIK